MNETSVFIHFVLQPYDFLSLVPVIEGVGGSITDWKGDKLHWPVTSESRPTSINLSSHLASQDYVIVLSDHVYSHSHNEILPLDEHQSCSCQMSRLTRSFITIISIMHIAPFEQQVFYSLHPELLILQVSMWWQQVMPVSTSRPLMHCSGDSLQHRIALYSSSSNLQLLFT
jgi:hypothetical protein